MNKEQLLKEIETQNLNLAELNTKLYELENKERADVDKIRKGKSDEINKLEKVLGKQGSAPQPDTIRGLLAYQPDDLESFTGVALTLILSALEQSTQATINALKMVD
ncbi:hypothetical protein [Enterococcus cecorum]|uniref:hypothetical protein n=1 Tax=Enterococcus cecorum TaxID=44008 RepID=UPI000B243A8F|nr:hypothetical protein [Enterococcus cecorum]CAI3342319.1 hypothetical protein CIRMBP1308_00359 [Enterococcus cecorum]